MYTLIGSPQTRAIRVIWCLEELGVVYEIMPLAPGSDEAKKYNPTGKVPALLVGDDVIIDSVAICQFLADKHGEMTYPAGSIERAKMDSWVQFAVDEVDQPCWVWSKNDFLYPEEIRVPEIKPACAREFKRAMHGLGERLGDNKYVMGETFTVPDILLGQCYGWAKFCGFDIPKGRVEDYFKRVCRRPAFIKALKIREADGK